MSRELARVIQVCTLPLALTNGSEKLAQDVFLKMERLFDCVIYPIGLDTVDLKWMTALWSGIDPEDDLIEQKKDLVKLRYRMPADANYGPDHIDVKFSGEQIRAYWKK